MIEPSKILKSPWLMAVLLFAIGMVAFTSHNTFRFYYHPDESGKVKQVKTGKRNFNHPLMLLTMSEWFTKVSAGKPAQVSSQKIVVAGRDASALFASITVVAFALLARRIGGIFAGWSVGIISLGNQSQFELAHYMKEDPSLAMGLALSYLALQFFWQRRTAIHLIFVGAACACAVSGKYLGLLILPFALPLILIPQSNEMPSRLRRVGWFLLGFAALWSLFNYPVFTHARTLVESLTRETTVAVEGHRGLTQSVPHLYYFRLYATNTPWIVSLFAFAGVANLFLRRKTSAPGEWIAFGFSVLLVAIMSFSPKVSARYFLPISTVVYYFAGMGCFRIAEWAASRFFKARRWTEPALCAACVVAVVCVITPPMKASNAGFQRDDHLALRAWIRENLPATAVIAQDDRVNLPNAEKPEYQEDDPMPQKIRRSEFVPDLGTLDELKARGVTHVAVCSATFLRFFIMFRPTEDVKEEFDRRKKFYEELQTRGKLVWSKKGGTVAYLQPGLFLYDIGGI